MAVAVVTVASGGVPVVDVTATTPKLGLPVTEALNGSGMAVTKVAGGGLPVTFSTVADYPPPSGALSPPLDDLTGVTGAWSFSRKMLTAWGGALKTASAGTVTVLNDQSGSARNFTGSTGDSTAGPNSRACGDFNGTTHSLGTGLTLGNFITVSSGYWIATILIDTFVTNNATPYQNSIIIGDSGSGWARMTVRSGNILYCYHWDGTGDTVQGTVNASTPYVVEWRHEGGNLYQRVNGTGETSVASGNSANLGSGSVVMSGGGFLLDGKVFEAATFSTVPSLAQRDALVANMKAYVGA